MAPHRDSEIFPPSTPSPRTMPKDMDTSGSSPKNIELPPSPDNDHIADVLPPAVQSTPESENELESESDLPIMTPPPTKQSCSSFRNTSPFHTTFGSNPHPSSSQMQRAHSSPGVDSTGRFSTPTHSYPRRPPSPLSSGRRRSPLRSTFEEPFPGSSWSGFSIEPNIPEHEELEIIPPITPENEIGHVSAMPTYTSISSTFPRSRRRPASPLHQSASAPSLHASARAAGMPNHNSTPPSFSTLSATKYANEPYPTYGYSFSSTSSMPSTPTSLRSRSPSISSLDTIEDIPDAEEAARLEEENNKQKSGDESETGSESKKKGLEIRGAGLRSNKERKRWSVCGAERRADFSLEVIEE